MQGRVAALFRHPIKGHGVEALTRTVLAPGAAMPWDRVWAVAHDAARIAPGARDWASCLNFGRGARTAALMAMRAQLDEAAGLVTLSHPDLPDLTIDPDLPQDAARLIDWVMPLMDPDRARPAFVVRAAGAWTDSDWPSVAVLGCASLRALEAQVGAPLAMERFRGNLWIEGLDPWAEFDWLGKEIAVGDVRLRVRERITRCRATMVNPATGRTDADTLGGLEAGWGHQDFGVYAEVVAGGPIALGDVVTA